MGTTRTRLLVVAAPAVAASLVVLALSGVGRDVWLAHLLALCLSVALARLRLPISAPGMVALSLAAVAATLLQGSPGPHRWIGAGPFTLYVAPLVMPSFLVACSALGPGQNRHSTLAHVATVAVAAVLALQPDAPQTLALLAGSAVAFLRSRSRMREPVVTLGIVAVAAIWAWSSPDPLAPVPHVEGVFALALDRSPWAGAAVAASAIGLVAGLWARSVEGPFWLAAVAAYYAVLFSCSVLGLTPAPLIGFGAGPLVGFGLMVAVSQTCEADVLSERARQDRHTPARP